MMDGSLAGLPGSACAMPLWWSMSNNACAGGCWRAEPLGRLGSASARPLGALLQVACCVCVRCYVLELLLSLP
jgi:hypothetical protein